jgi:mono/diheme cytochrome c family protein
MRGMTYLAAAAMWAGSAAWVVPSAVTAQNAVPVASGADRYEEVISRYCIGCHNERAHSMATASGVAFDKLSVYDVGRDAEQWEKVVVKLSTGAMPPQGSRRPEKAVYDDLESWVAGELDRHEAAHPNPGRPLLHRLNRAEYANAIRDLLALDVDAASLLPADDSAYGFDNVADVLGVSPSLQERYLAAAGKISRLAVGDRALTAVAQTVRVRADVSQNEHIEGLPLGTVGGMLIDPTFPLDAEYVIQVKLQHTNFGNLRGLDYPHDVEIAVDGRRVHLARIGGDADLTAMFAAPKEAGDKIEARLVARVPVKAGPRHVSVAFIRNLPLGDTRRLQPFLRSSADTLDWTGLPHIQSITITGPFNATGLGDTPSRRRIFVCRPQNMRAEPACATHIISTLLRRAYREPIGDADVRPILNLYQHARKDGDFDAGIRTALKAILASPRFVFRAEPEPSDTPPGGIYRLGDVELASRLSFFLWSSIPDDELMGLAAQNKLHEPAILDAQVRRLLAHPKSEALVTNFAGQWLQLRNMKSVQPNSDEFPDFDDNLRRSMQRESELFFDSIIREDRSVLDLLDADYTFIDERLARHYGIANVYGSRFRRITVADDRRRGLLGQASILALTSHAERTSPVSRGKWILENILGTPPPPPPPDVPSLKSAADGDKPATLRALMTEHRSNPACASCHKVMDPLGFALENFDAVGAWRVREPGGPIDASGELVDGTRIDGVVGLRAALMARPDVFVTTMTRKMLTYALGRGLEYHDMPVVRAIVRDVAANHDRFSSLVLGIVHSMPFQMRVRADDGQVVAAN